MSRTPVPTYDRHYEYRADFDGHEVAGFIVAPNIIEAAKAIGEDYSWGQERTEVRFLAEVKRTTCCQRGDWSGADHQPSTAFLFVPATQKHVFRGEVHTHFLPEYDPAVYRWSCDYCGTEGTAAQLDPSRNHA